jgi:hypothetical protein
MAALSDGIANKHSSSIFFVCSPSYLFIFERTATMIAIGSTQAVKYALPRKRVNNACL